MFTTRLLLKLTQAIKDWVLLIIKLALPVVCYINSQLLVTAQTVSYEWEPAYYAYINGEEKLVFTWDFPVSKIAVGNLVGDSLPDLVVGSESGTLSLYENVGTLTEPKFRLIELRLEGYGELSEAKIFRQFDDKYIPAGTVLAPTAPFDFGSRAAPALVKLDRLSNKLDLLVGNADGDLFLLFNEGTIHEPKFTYIKNKSQLFSQLENFELGLKNAVPSFCNLNNDERDDLIIGSADGRILIFLGRRDAQRYLYYTGQPDFELKLTSGENAAASCVDWEDNKQPAVIAGQKDGYLSYFKNIGTPFAPKFSAPEDFFYKLDAGGESAPYFTKLTSKSDDLLLGSLDSQIKRFEFRQFDGSKNIWSVNDNITNFARLQSFSNNTSIAAGNLFGNNKQDIILSNYSGALTMYRNDSDGQNIRLARIGDNILADFYLPMAAPEIVDFIPDKLPVLLVGVEGGKIYYFDNQGTAQAPDFRIADNNLLTVADINHPIVRGLDIEKSGKFDLLVGGSGGELKFFKNIGSADTPEFDEELEDLIVGKYDFPSNFSAPSIFSWNKFLAPNLVVGNDEGGISILNFNPQLVKLLPDLPVDFQEYLAAPFYFPNWRYQEEMPKARPYFLDILSNNRPAMLVSNEDGDMLLFLQKKFELLDTEKIFDTYLSNRRQRRLERVNQIVANFKPKNVNPQFVSTNQRLIEKSGLNPVPYLGNLRYKDLSDLVVGYKDGRIDIFVNQGSKDFWLFFKQQTVTLPPGEEDAAPALLDIDNNGSLDMVVGSKSGNLYFFQNTAKKPNYEFRLVPGYFDNIKLGKNVVPATVYIKNESLPDIVTGDINGKLMFIDNLSSYRNAVFKPRFILRDMAEFRTINSLLATPRFADLNNDDVLEMIIGDDQGRVKIYNYKQMAAGKYAWEENTTWAPNIKIGFKAAPAFADLHGYGIKDMVVASQDGDIILFRNEAVNESTLEQLKSQELEKLENQ